MLFSVGDVHDVVAAPCRYGPPSNGDPPVLALYDGFGCMRTIPVTLPPVCTIVVNGRPTDDGPILCSVGGVGNCGM